MQAIPFLDDLVDGSSGAALGAVHPGLGSACRTVAPSKGH